MDHDKQITQWLQDPKAFFLAEDISHQGERPPVYILEEEFAKTSRNRPYWLYLLMVLVSGGVVMVSLFVGYWYRNQVATTTVSIPDFHDLNLKEVLASYAKSLDALSQAKFELENLKQEYRGFQAKIRQRRIREEMLLAQEDLSEAEKNARLASLATNFQRELKQLDDTYLPQIQTKQEEIAKLEAESQQYHKEVKEVGPKSSLVDSTREVYEAKLKQQQQHYNMQLEEQRKRYEQEKNELKNYYERYIQALILRYNPVLSTPGFQEALQYKPSENFDQFISSGSVWIDVIKRYRLSVSLESIILQSRYQEMLLKRLMIVPYTNSVPLALLQLFRFSSGIITGYETLGKVVGENLDEREKLWKRTFDALAKYVRQRKENGLVLSPEVPALVIIDPVYPVKTGLLGYVFRQDNQRIAKVRFIVSNYQTIFADVVEWYDPAREFQILDRVVLHLKGE